MAIPEWVCEKIKELVGEHCHGWVFAAEIEDPTPGNPDARRTVSMHGGSLNRAIGLSRRMGRKLDTMADMTDEWADGHEGGDDGDEPEEAEVDL